MRENSKRIDYRFQPGNKVLASRISPSKYKRPHNGPDEILQVDTNGIVCLQMGAVRNVVNIRCIHPYKQ